MIGTAGLIVGAAPGAIGFGILTTLVAGVAPPAAAFLFAKVLDGLAGEGQADVSRLSLFSVLAVGCGAVGTAASYASGFLSSRIQQAVVRRATTTLYSHVNSFVGLRPFEDPQFHDRLRVAERAVDSSPSDLVVFAIGFVRQASGIVAYLAVLISLWPPMAGLLAVAAIPALLAQVVLSRQGATATRTAVTDYRWNFYYRSLLTDPVSAKEIRAFGIGPLVHERMMAALDRMLNSQLRQNRRSTLTEVLFVIVNGAVSGVGAVVVVRAVTNGGVTLGDLSLFLAAVGTVQSSLSELILLYGRAAIGLELLSSYTQVLDMTSDVDDGSRPVSDLLREVRHSLGSIRAAARATGVDSHLMALPSAYETLLSRQFDDEGTSTTLSGGLWQRVALARALLRDRADLLILDEPSAGLDPSAESELHQTITTHRFARTSLLIASTQCDS